MLKWKKRDRNNDKQFATAGRTSGGGASDARPSLSSTSTSTSTETVPPLSPLHVPSAVPPPSDYGPSGKLRPKTPPTSLRSRLASAANRHRDRKHSHALPPLARSAFAQRHPPPATSSTSSSAGPGPLLPELPAAARTSLIMPHLTRRFTLLRHDDSNDEQSDEQRQLAQIDQVRAQLRTQRERSEAIFLTQEEENEIIESMRQTMSDPQSTPTTPATPFSSFPTTPTAGWHQWNQWTQWNQPSNHSSLSTTILGSLPTTPLTPSLRTPPETMGNVGSDLRSDAPLVSSSSATSGLDRLADQLHSTMTVAGRTEIETRASGVSSALYSSRLGSKARSTRDGEQGIPRTSHQLEHHSNQSQSVGTDQHHGTDEQQDNPGLQETQGQREHQQDQSPVTLTAPSSHPIQPTLSALDSAASADDRWEDASSLADTSMTFSSSSDLCIPPHRDEEEKDVIADMPTPVRRQPSSHSNRRSQIKSQHRQSVLDNMSPEAYKRVSQALEEVFELMASPRSSNLGSRHSRQDSFHSIAEVARLPEHEHEHQGDPSGSNARDQAMQHLEGPSTPVPTTAPTLASTTAPDTTPRMTSISSAQIPMRYGVLSAELDPAPGHVSLGMDGGTAYDDGTPVFPRYSSSGMAAPVVTPERQASLGSIHASEPLAMDRPTEDSTAAVVGTTDAQHQPEPQFTHQSWDEVTRPTHSDKDSVRAEDTQGSTTTEDLETTFAPSVTGWGATPLYGAQPSAPITTSLKLPKSPRGRSASVRAPPADHDEPTLPTSTSSPPWGLTSRKLSSGSSSSSGLPSQNTLGLGATSGMVALPSEREGLAPAPRARKQSKVQQMAAQLESRSETPIPTKPKALTGQLPDTWPAVAGLAASAESAQSSAVPAVSAPTAAVSGLPVAARTEPPAQDLTHPTTNASPLTKGTVSEPVPATPGPTLALSTAATEEGKADPALTTTDGINPNAGSATSAAPEAVPGAAPGDGSVPLLPSEEDIESAQQPVLPVHPALVPTAEPIPSAPTSIPTDVTIVAPEPASATEEATPSPPATTQYSEGVPTSSGSTSAPTLPKPSPSRASSSSTPTFHDASPSTPPFYSAGPSTPTSPVRPGKNPRSPVRRSDGNVRTPGRPHSPLPPKRSTSKPPPLPIFGSVSSPPQSPEVTSPTKQRGTRSQGSRSGFSTVGSPPLPKDASDVAARASVGMMRTGSVGSVRPVGTSATPMTSLPQARGMARTGSLGSVGAGSSGTPLATLPRAMARKGSVASVESSVSTGEAARAALSVGFPTKRLPDSPVTGDVPGQDTEQVAPAPQSPDELAYVPARARWLSTRTDAQPTETSLVALVPPRKSTGAGSIGYSGAIQSHLSIDQPESALRSSEEILPRSSMSTKEQLVNSDSESDRLPCTSVVLKAEGREDMLAKHARSQSHDRLLAELSSLPVNPLPVAMPGHGRPTQREDAEVQDAPSAVADARADGTTTQVDTSKDPLKIVLATRPTPPVQSFTTPNPLGLTLRELRRPKTAISPYDHIRNGSSSSGVQAPPPLGRSMSDSPHARGRSLFSEQDPETSAMGQATRSMEPPDTVPPLSPTYTPIPDPRDRSSLERVAMGHDPHLTDLGSPLARGRSNSSNQVPVSDGAPNMPASALLPGTSAPPVAATPTPVSTTHAPGTLVPAPEIPNTLVPAPDIPGTLVPAPEIPGTLVPAPSGKSSRQSGRSRLGSPRMSPPHLRKSPQPLESPPSNSIDKKLGMGLSPSQPELVPPTLFRRPSSLTRRKSEHDSTRTSGLGLGLSHGSNRSNARRSGSARGLGKLISRFGSMGRRNKEDTGTLPISASSLFTPKVKRGRSLDPQTSHTRQVSTPSNPTPAEAFVSPPPPNSLLPTYPSAPEISSPTVEAPPPKPDTLVNEVIPEVVVPAKEPVQPPSPAANAPGETGQAPKEAYDTTLPDTSVELAVSNVDQKKDSFVPAVDTEPVESTESATLSSPTSPTGSQGTKKEQRKTGREVVRRTLIFIDDGDEKRKSIISLAAQRKSGKKHNGSKEAEAELLALLRRQSIPDATNQDAAMASLEGRNESSNYRTQDGTDDVRSIDGASMEHLAFTPQAYRSDLPTGLTPRISHRSLRSSNATRFTQSSYTGSVYSTLTAQNEVSFEAREHDMPPIPAEYRDAVKSRPQPPVSPLASNRSPASPLPNGAEGIEITEHADGSVVWQVIRDLARRESGMSSTARRSVAYLSDRFSFFPGELRSPRARDSTWSGDADSVLEFARDSGSSVAESSVSPRPLLGHSSTTPDDLRAFFTSHRAATQATPLPDDLYNLPLPDLPTCSSHSQPPQDDLGSEHDEPDTHLIWTTDQDVSAMLESLSRGIDSAKFEIKLDGNSPDPRAGHGSSSWTLPPPRSSSGVNWEEEQAHRLRVEEEIYSLLAAHGAPPSSSSQHSRSPINTPTL